MLASFYDDVVKGFDQQPREIPSKYLYDQQGSLLFDAICELDEYYPTRTELSIMEQYADEIASQIGPQTMLVEFGSGSSIKTRILLGALNDPVAYVPLDISHDYLMQTAAGLQTEFPHIEILPLVADFTEEIQLPDSTREPDHCAVYFPGSTIGNLSREASVELLAQIADLVGPDGGLLIGVDLQKDISVIEAAYNDAAGLTARFNKNLLARINRELDGTFDPDSFSHRAVYSEQHGRVEISLVSDAKQVVRIGQQEFRFDTGDSILTEYSHKFTIEGFAALADQAGFQLHKAWTDPRKYFAVLHLVHLPRSL